MPTYRLWVALLFFPSLIVGCSSYSTSHVDPSGMTAVTSAKEESQIIVTQSDITDRSYVPLGDVTVTVYKTTIFNADPTHADVDQRLRTKAAEMGGDAVILVRYGTVGIGAMSWGELEGKGRVVVFQ